METYEAKFSYNEEAKGVIKFQKGDTFYIIEKKNEKWWLAKRLSDSLCGYVPALYLEECKEKVIGKLVPEDRRNTKEHDIHLQALAEIHKRIKPLPAHVIENALGVKVPEDNTRSQKSNAHSRRKTHPFGNHSGPASHYQASPNNGYAPTNQNRGNAVLTSHKMVAIEDDDDEDLLPQLNSPPPCSPPPPDYDLEEDDQDANNIPYHHKLNSSGRLEDRIPIPDDDDVDDEVQEIKPRPLAIPVVQSKERNALHRELRLSGRKVLEQPELKKVFQERRLTEKKKEMQRHQIEKRTSMEIKLEERHLKLLKEERKAQNIDEEDALKPEFAKLKLRQTTSSKT